MPTGIHLFDLTGKSVLLTGGTKGLGRAMAEGLAEAGADVLLTSRHGEEAAQTAREIAQKSGRKVMGIAADVSSPQDIEKMVAKAISDLGKIDVLVNNAGINIRAPIEELTYEEYRQVQTINVDGLWLSCRAVVPHMKQRGSGRIINLASSLSVIGLPRRTAYTASKGAVIQITRTLGIELAAFGITCNAICPGPFLTPLNEPIADSEETKQFLLGAVPLARWGRLEEIQGAAIYLASDASSYVTGSLLFVDGGWTAR